MPGGRTGRSLVCHGFNQDGFRDQPASGQLGAHERRDGEGDHDQTYCEEDPAVAIHCSASESCFATTAQIGLRGRAGDALGLRLAHLAQALVARRLAGTRSLGCAPRRRMRATRSCGTAFSTGNGLRTPHVVHRPHSPHHCAMGTNKFPNPGPRTPEERAKLREEVRQHVANATPDQRAAVDLRRAIAQAAIATKH
jgi:hypothetical protein